MRPKAPKSAPSRRRYFVGLNLEQLEARIALTAYYVSNTGSDSNDGLSPATAWQTFAAIQQHPYNTSPPAYYGAGDQILFQGGQTFTGQLYLSTRYNSIGNEANPIVVGSYGSGRATLHSTSTTGQSAVLTLLDLGGVKIQNLNIQGPGTTAGSYFHGISITDSGYITSARMSGITVDQVDIGGCSGSGITFHSPTQGYVGYNNLRITNATLHDCQFAGLGFTARATTGYYPYTNLYVGNVTAFNNPGSAGQTNGFGMDLADVSQALIEQCLVYSNGGSSGNSTSGGASGIGVILSSNVVVQYCEVYDTRTNPNDPAAIYDGNGIDFDWGTQNSTMQYNYVHDNYGAGLADLAPARSIAATNTNNVIRFNVSAKNSVRNAYGEISVFGGASNLDIYNNTVYARDYSQAVAGTSGALRIVSDQATPYYSNVRVLDNIFLTHQNTPLIVVFPGANNTFAQFYGNEYWNYSGQLVYWFNGALYHHLSELQNANVMEKLNGAPTGSEVDPQIAAPGFDGSFLSSGVAAAGFAAMTAYRLASTSPVLNAGVDLKNVLGISPGANDFYSQSLATDPLGRSRANLTANPGADQFYSMWAVVAAADFSGDGKADVLWQNKASGVVGAWVTDGGWLGLGQADLTAWTIACAGDFSGDGKADVLWQNKTTGMIGAWITGGNWLYLGTNSSAQWLIAAAADFSGDGKADVLWQNKTTGVVGGWITGGNWLYLGTVPSTQWKIAGAADFSGDGKADILWANATTGVVGAWITGGNWLGLGLADFTAWSIACAGDFSGDGKADVLWQNTSTGVVGGWVTGGSWLGLGQADAATWAIVGAADFDGDSKTDVLWENQGTGVVGAWITGKSWKYLGTV